MQRLTQEEIHNGLARCPNWKLDGAVIALEWKGTDFRQTFDLMTQIAEVAEEINHHPDWCNSFRRLSIRLTTHDVGGLSQLDFIMAERIDVLIGRLEQK